MKNDIDSFNSDSVPGNDGLDEESEVLEEFTEETEESFGSEDKSGSDDDNVLVGIDYSKLQASVRDAQIINTIDTDLNDLPISDVLLLIIALILGIFIVGGKRK